MNLRRSFPCLQDTCTREMRITWSIFKKEKTLPAEMLQREIFPIQCRLPCVMAWRHNFPWRKMSQDRIRDAALCGKIRFDSWQLLVWFGFCLRKGEGLHRKEITVYTMWSEVACFYSIIQNSKTQMMENSETCETWRQNIWKLGPVYCNALRITAYNKKLKMPGNRYWQIEIQTL